MAAALFNQVPLLQVPGHSWTDPKTGITVTIPGSDYFVQQYRDPYQDFVYLAQVCIAVGLFLSTSPRPAFHHCAEIFMSAEIFIHACIHSLPPIFSGSWCRWH